LLRPLVVASTVRLFGHAAPTALMTGVLLAQIGELSFVLAKLGVDRGFISGELYGLILGSALISILVNPLWIRGGAAWARRRRATARRPAEPEGRLEGVARLADHVVICGCGRVGSAVVERLRAQEIPYVVIELDAVRIEELRRKGEPYLFGDASSLYILRSAGIERARLLAITYNDPVASELTIRRVLELCPSLKVIARAHRAADVGRLRSAGAAEVVYPEFEAGLEFVRWTLEEIGVSVEGIEDLIRRGRDAFSPVRNPDGPPEHTGPGT
ncbi:MAG: NAD-binding protein, partial [Deltaproteobacteria bacterium]|nr:NAD-binding protein [Deltaproteobacteria bacterium]